MHSSGKDHSGSSFGLAHILHPDRYTGISGYLMWLAEVLGSKVVLVALCMYFLIHDAKIVF